jgi:hypothetical protein
MPDRKTGAAGELPAAGTAAVRFEQGASNVSCSRVDASSPNVAARQVP